MNELSGSVVLGFVFDVLSAGALVVIAFAAGKALQRVTHLEKQMDRIIVKLDGITVNRRSVDG